MTSSFGFKTLMRLGKYLKLEMMKKIKKIHTSEECLTTKEYRICVHHVKGCVKRDKICRPYEPFT